MLEIANQPIQRLLTPIELTVNQRVISKKNSKRILTNYRSHKTVVLPSKGFESFKELALVDLQVQMYKLKAKGVRFPLPSPYKIEVYFWLKGKSTTDIDNMVTSIFDLLQDKELRIIEDDRNIVEVHALKHQNASDYSTSIVIRPAYTP